MAVERKTCGRDDSKACISKLYRGGGLCEEVLCRFVKLALDTWKEDGEDDGGKVEAQGIQDRNICKAKPG